MPIELTTKPVISDETTFADGNIIIGADSTAAASPKLIEFGGLFRWIRKKIFDATVPTTRTIPRFDATTATQLSATAVVITDQDRVSAAAVEMDILPALAPGPVPSRAGHAALMFRSVGSYIWPTMVLSNGLEKVFKTAFTPAVTTDNAIPRWLGTEGAEIEDTGVLIDDLNNVRTPRSVVVGETVEFEHKGIIGARAAGHSAIFFNIADGLPYRIDDAGIIKPLAPLPKKDLFTPIDGQTVFNLSNIPEPGAALTVMINGVGYHDPSDFTVSSANVTWLNSYGIKFDDEVAILYS
jgi:hypothetical protein